MSALVRRAVRAAQWNVDNVHLGVSASTAHFNRDGHTDIIVARYGQCPD